VLLLAIILYYWKPLLTNQFSVLTGQEGVNQAYAWLNFWAHSIRQGTWPLWDPYTFSGHIFSGEMQTGSFYPLYIPLALFPLNQHGLFSPSLYRCMYGAAHFLGAWFMFLLVRELELGDFAAVVAGICFSLGGLMGRFTDWPHLLNSGIWLPLIFLFLLRAMKAGGTRTILYASACGVSLGLSILAGGLHMAIMQAVAIVTAAVFHGFGADSDAAARRSRKRWRQSALIAGVAGLAAFASSAIQLLPSMEYSRLALRFAGGAALPASERIPYRYLTDQLYAHGILNLLIAIPRNRIGLGETISPYLGVFPLLLAVIGVWKKWQCRWVRYLTGLAIAAFAYSLGSVSLLHGVLYVFAPYLWLAREAGRFMYLADFALAVLAAYGAHALFSSAGLEWEPLGKILKWLVWAGMLVVALPALYSQPELSPWVSLSLVLIVASWLLFRYIVSGHTGNSTRVLAVAMILFDLYAFDWSAANRAEMSAKGADHMEQLLSCSGVAQFLKSRDGLFRAQVAMDGAPNIGDVFQVQTTGGSGVTLVTDYQRFNGHTDLLNVRYIVKPATAADAGAVYGDAAWKVYENPHAYPRAWLVHDTLVERTPAELLQRLDAPGTDPHRVALLESGLDAPLDPSPEIAGEQVRFVRYEANRMDLSVHAGGRALLVLSELYYPGWTATVNGRPARIWKIDGALRGVVAPRGDSRISLQYRPASIYIGAVLTVAAFGALLSAAIWLWFRRRRSQPRPPAPDPSARSAL